MKFWTVALLAAGCTAAQAQGVVGDASIDTPAVAEAKANRARLKVAPTVVREGIDAMRAAKDAERGQGHHGLVVVEGVVGIDGRMMEPHVRTSSRAAGLDALALAAAKASVLTPAKDDKGTPIPIWIAMPFEFKNRAFQENGGAKRYLCSEFVQDMGWWRATWPERTWGDHEFYKMMLGFRMLGFIQSARGDQARLREAIAGFDARWQTALDRCAAKPNARFAEVSGLMTR